MGVWTPIWRTSLGGEADWQARLECEDGSVFHVKHGNETGTVSWGMSGVHSVSNGLVAIAAAYHVGVPVAVACEALSNFAGIKRRMELIGEVGGVQVYDDFAHHPTAIATTLDGAKKKLQGQKIWAIIEPRSNTMKLGSHKDALAPSASLANQVIWYEPKDLAWGLSEAVGDTPNQVVLGSIDEILGFIDKNIQTGDAIVVMSNGGFEGIHGKIIELLKSRDAFK